MRDLTFRVPAGHRHGTIEHDAERPSAKERGPQPGRADPDQDGPDPDFRGMPPLDDAGDALPPAILGTSRYAPGWDIGGCLWRRKWLILCVAALAMAGFSALILGTPKTYQAQAMVLFQADRPSADRGDDPLRDPAFAPDTLSNEIETLLSDQLLTTVATRLDLIHNPDFLRGPGPIATAAWAVAGILPDGMQPQADQFLTRLGLGHPTKALPDRPLDEAVAALRGRLTIGPVGLSRILRITAQSRDPVLAARLANGVVRVYVDMLAADKDTATAAAHKWIDQRLDSLRERATQSALTYEAFRHATGLARGKDSTITQEQMTQISSELTRIRQARISAELALSQSDGVAGADLDQLASATGSQLLPKLREQLSEATSRLAERRVVGGDAMPAVFAARAQVADITRSIAAERERIRQTLRKQVAVSRATEQRMNATLAELRTDLQASETSSAQADALQRDANADQETYTNFLTRSRQTDPDLNYTAPGARVVSSAAVPLRPMAPNQRVLFPAAMVVSLGLGLVAGFIRDSARKGIHSLRDLPGGRTGGSACSRACHPATAGWPMCSTRRRRRSWPASCCPAAACRLPASSSPRRCRGRARPARRSRLPRWPRIAGCACCWSMPTCGRVACPPPPGC